ncbi:MAG: hypothetical protein U1A78_41485 [Polyangia bacterium]
MRSGTRRWLLGLGLGLGTLPALAHGDEAQPLLGLPPTVPPGSATCSPRREEESGLYGRTVIHRQVEYDFRVGEVRSDAAELRRALNIWTGGRLPYLRECAPDQSLLLPPERLTATLHLLLQRRTLRLSSMMLDVAGSRPSRPRLDKACIERMLALEHHNLLQLLQTAAPMGRATVTLQYAPYCVVSREPENPPPASAATFGPRTLRHLMPESSSQAQPPPPPAPPPPSSPPR